MIPSSHATASFGTTAWDEDSRLEHGTRGLGMPPPWSLPAHEVAKMERLERGEALAVPPMVESCLHRLAEVEAGWPQSPFRRAFRTRHPPSAEEVAAMIAEVPLCLLSGRQRLQALALRQQGLGAPETPAPDFDTHASRNDLIIATMDALQAARGGTGAPWIQALAQLARWETDASSDRDAEARASGGRALREVVKDTLQESLRLDGQGLTRQRARQFSLPPPAVLAKLDLDARDFAVVLRDARPVDLDAFRDSLTALDLRCWQVSLGDEPDVRLSLIPDCATHVDLRGDPDRCGRLAVALAHEPDRALLLVHVPADTDDRLEAPGGWRVERSAMSWLLSREPLPQAGGPAAVLADWGAKEPEALWKAIEAFDDGPILVDFLAACRSDLDALGPLYADIVRQEMMTRSRSLLQMLAAEPALLSELSNDLAGPWTCIDAKRKTLASMDQMLRAGSDPGALLRMSLHHLADRHVGIHDPGGENLEHSLALQALIDLRLTQITAKSFTRTGVPYFAVDSGMNHRALRGEPTLRDWPDGQQEEVEQILGNEVRDGFPMLREFMQSTSGAAHRAVERLQLDPSYRAANAAWEQRFLEAGNLADDDPSDVAAAQRYEEAQAQMPLELDKLRFALMDEWLDPLRKAYPAAASAQTTS